MGDAPTGQDGPAQVFGLAQAPRLLALLARAVRALPSGVTTWLSALALLAQGIGTQLLVYLAQGCRSRAVVAVALAYRAATWREAKATANRRPLLLLTPLRTGGLLLLTPPPTGGLLLLTLHKWSPPPPPSCRAAMPRKLPYDTGGNAGQIFREQLCKQRPVSLDLAAPRTKRP